MPQSLVKNYIHIVFSTKYRQDFIDEEIEKELFSYIAVLCKDFESPALQIVELMIIFIFYVFFHGKYH